MSEVSEVRKLGREFTKGVFDELSKFCCLILVISFVYNHIFNPLDDSDVSRWDRSGMKISTDHKTGKQYFLSPYGGIIERGQR